LTGWHPGRIGAWKSRMSLEFCDRTDIGRRRANNQDAKAVLEPWSREQYRRRGWLFLVADGMGAHAAGEMASQIAAEQVPLVYEKAASCSPPFALRKSIEHANTEIHARGESSTDLKGMGTTCTTLVIVPRGALVGHVGDSRAYRVRRGRIEQWSRDHSLVWDLELEASRKGNPHADFSATPKNIITRSMGPHPQVAVDVEGPFTVEADDTFVLCSDGLSGQVADAEIGLFASLLPPRDAAAALVGLALVRGAPDNVTVIVARASEKEASKTSPQDDPWPLSDVSRATTTPAVVPWRLLALAAGCLLGALILQPLQGPMAANGPFGKFLGEHLRDHVREAVGWVLSGALALTSMAAVITAMFQYLSPPEQTSRLLRPGERLGEGPYRSYDCAPTPDLVEGIIASVELAADGLGDEEKSPVITGIGQARRAASAGDLPLAVATAAAAIAAYARCVEAARGG
jgi:serine/threonine protein phosphatase PrpC